jgi:hypothetical protein
MSPVPGRSLELPHNSGGKEYLYCALAANARTWPAAGVGRLDQAEEGRSCATPARASEGTGRGGQGGDGGGSIGAHPVGEGEHPHGATVYENDDGGPSGSLSGFNRRSDLGVFLAGSFGARWAGSVGASSFHRHIVMT